MKICSHTLVKNEERYIWYSLTSIVEHMDQMIVWDTGSTDKTFEIIKEFQKQYPKKVLVNQYFANTADEVKRLRQKMLEQTSSDWIFVLDGDEVWWNQSIAKVVETIKNYGDKLDSIVVPFTNLIGDIYHYQDERSGGYLIDGKKGFLTIRAINRNILGLHVDKPYPLEGYYNGQNLLVQDLSSSRRMHIKSPYMHFSHLVRSKDLENDKKAVARINKNKVELGKSFPLDYYYPESFFKPKPSIVASPWKAMNYKYYFKSLVITPIRKVKKWTK